MKISVVSPTYNEAGNLSRLIAEIGAAVEALDYEIIIVDDNSPDGTWDKAERIAQINPRLRVIRRLKNRGLSQAVVEGFLAARGDYIACIDADLQHDPRILPQLIAALDDGSEVAVGSRYVSGGGTGEWNHFRRLESWVATKLAQFFLGVALRDPMSGYFILRRRDFVRICTLLDVRGFKILLEIVAQLAPNNLMEVPYTFRTRAAGESKLSSKVILQYLGQLWRLSSVSRYTSVRFIKFALVGTWGVFINLCIFMALSRMLGIQDWRISAAASSLSNLSNYIANNAWAFVHSGHRGWAVARGYASYLLTSLLGLSASTATFAVLYYGFHRQSLQELTGTYPKPIIVGFQLISILVGVFFNYVLNRLMTWRDRTKDKTREEHFLDKGGVSRKKLDGLGKTRRAGDVQGA
jgi:dolichol-phosphate mannosyltransferase